MAGRLAGKVALITGTGGQQGRVASLRFAAEGALVVGCDLNAEASEETVRLVKDDGHDMVAMSPVDLGDSVAARQWVDEAVAVHGRVDVLYNNASAARMPFVGDFTDDDWHFTIRNELDLVFYVTQQAWPHLIASRGVIVNVASVQGHIGTPFSGGLAHAATKAGVSAMTRQLAAEGAQHGIRAVCISPGPIIAPELIEAFGDALVEQLKPQLMIERMGRADDVVRLAVHLASDDAGFITGSDYIVDGGMSAK